jgi:hypothetical protein
MFRVVITLKYYFRVREVGYKGGSDTTSINSQDSHVEKAEDNDQAEDKEHNESMAATNPINANQPTSTWKPKKKAEYVEDMKKITIGHIEGEKYTLTDLDLEFLGRNMKDKEDMEVLKLCT